MPEGVADSAYAAACVMMRDVEMRGVESAEQCKRVFAHALHEASQQSGTFAQKVLGALTARGISHTPNRPMSSVEHHTIEHNDKEITVSFSKNTMGLYEAYILEGQDCVASSTPLWPDTRDVLVVEETQAETVAEAIAELMDADATDSEDNA